LPDPDKNEITLQINLCAGDADYAARTVPKLVRQFREQVEEVLVVVDECLPQASPVFRPRERFDPQVFGDRLEKVRKLVSEWRVGGLVDRVENISPGMDRIRQINRKYTGWGTGWTHDHWGHAFTAYFAGWELARGRFILHADADIFLYDGTGGRWLEEAVVRLEREENLLAVSPRIAPPIGGEKNSRMVRIGEKDAAWLPTWRLEAGPDGWRSDWLSTRFHLLDRKKLNRLRPLHGKRGALGNAWAYGVNALLFPLYGRRAWTAGQSPDAVPEILHRIFRKMAHHWIPPFPLPPEVLVHEENQKEGMKVLYLNREDLWFVHPETKPKEFLEVLENLLKKVPKGECPGGQRGLAGIQFGLWKK
jgi:hypothetical protein